MPVGTVDVENYERFDLKSLPAVGEEGQEGYEEGGFVMLRPLPYSKIVVRRDNAMKMRMIQQRQKRNQPAPDQQVIDLEQMGSWTTEFDWTYCIGDHNITDTKGRKLDFKTSAALRMSLQTLNPKVGLEIEKLIDSLNQDEDDETMEDFLARREASLEKDPILSSTDITE